jgi:TetR/AcrR family transcriptional regulator, transcriptional repressor for nem operon
MRKSRQETAETRQRILEAAAAEFRRSGIGSTGIAELMAAAGLTHGGFYKHFESKDQIVEESIALATRSLATAIESKLSSAKAGHGLNAVLKDYLSAERLEHCEEGCPFGTLGSELARSNERVRQATTEGFVAMVTLIAGQLDDLPPVAAKKQAMVMLSTMIGAITMARIFTDSDLSVSLLRETRKHLVK